MSSFTAKVGIAVALIVGTPGRALDLPLAKVQVVAQLLTLTSVNSNQISENEAYRNGKDRFVKTPDSREIWFQDAKTQSVHLIRFNCNACGEPPLCSNSVLVSKEYVASKPIGEDFSCNMLHGIVGHTYLPIVTTTHTLPPRVQSRNIAMTSTTTNATAVGGSSSGAGWIFVFLVLVCCCLGGLGFAPATYHFISSHCAEEVEDQEPLVPDVPKNVDLGPFPPPAAFHLTGVGQQQPPQQEMELVTITPEGYSVLPLAPGQGVPAGVPVFSQLPQI